MNLRELINKLENLSKSGINDNLPVVFELGNTWEDYPEITSVYLNIDPDFNFEEWIELKISREDKKFFGLDKLS